MLIKVPPPYLILITGVVALGMLGFGDFRARLDAHVLHSRPNDLANITDPLVERVSGLTDPNQLMAIGRHMLASHEPDLAVLVFERVEQIAPNSRDAHLYVAWALLAELATNTLSASAAAAAAQEAKAALSRAHDLDPNDPLVRQLIEQLTSRTSGLAEKP